jgi:hypothetical protein
MFKRIIRQTEKFADCTAELKAALSSFGVGTPVERFPFR